MLIFLKIASLVVVAIGAFVALFGDSRRDGRLTRLGRFAATLLLAGFMCSVGIEFVQSHQDSLKEAMQKKEARKLHEWELVSESPIRRVVVNFYHRKEMSLADFADYVSRIQVSFVAPPANAHGKTRERTLTFRLRDDESGPDGPLFLNVNRGLGDRPIARATLYRKEILRSQDYNPKATLTEPMPSAPNPPSETAGIRRVSGTVVATSYVSRHGWPYTSSSDHDWGDPSALTCGVRGSVPWTVIAGDGRATNLREFAATGSVRVTLREGIDLRIVDGFHLTFFAGNRVLSLDLANLTYVWGDDQLWSVTLTGLEVYSLLKTEVVSR